MLILAPSIFWTIFFTTINGLLLFWLIKKAFKSVLEELGLEIRRKETSVKQEMTVRL